MNKTDTLIIGAGLIGSSVAMHLSQLGMKDISVLDFDLEGSLSSSELNAGGVRATWILPVNIQLSKISIEYFSKVAHEVGYRPSGYLWLHSESKYPFALSARETQIAQGWPVEIWDLKKLQNKVPFIDKLQGIGGVLFSPQDGLVNPNLLKLHYRALAKQNGVRFLDRTWVYGASRNLKQIEIQACKVTPDLSAEQKQEVLKNFRLKKNNEETVFCANRVINCAGPWAPEIAKVLGAYCPSFPVRRQVSLFDTREVDLTPYGMIVDTSGVYFHPEASYGLAGFADPDEPHGVRYEYDGEKFFEEKIWSPLSERSSGFEKLKHITGWVGMYEVSPDETAILGECGPHSFEAHSFSGHGAMQSYAAGLALSELICYGKFKTLDASSLNAKRFKRGELLREGLII